MPNQISIRIVTAPYLLATKFEAFKGRGKNDYMSSHDLEDIVTIIDGREEVVEEIKDSSEEIRDYLIENFKITRREQAFLDTLPGHMNQYGRYYNERARFLLQRLDSIIGLKT